jgi:hypothetical protein
MSFCHSSELWRDYLELVPGVLLIEGITKNISVEIRQPSSKQSQNLDWQRIQKESCPKYRLGGGPLGCHKQSRRVCRISCEDLF